MLSLKPIPSISWDNMIPPNMHYSYYEHGTDLPFEWAAHGFSLINAWWLSEAALLAYAPVSFVQSCSQKAGFETVHYFNGPSTKCYLSQCNRFSILAFRGTESNLRNGPNALGQFIADLRTDFNFRLIKNPGGGRIHRGFQKGLDEVWKDIVPYLHRTSECPLWITGHSLGGALATLAASRWNNTRAVYTFGSPRVGDEDFASQFNTPAFRFVNHRDLITKVPPHPYTHVGQTCRLDNQGRLVFTENQRRSIFNRIYSKFSKIKVLFRELKVSSAAALPEGFKDHMPLVYVLHIWNNLVGAHSLLK